MKQTRTDFSSLVFHFLNELKDFQYRLSGYDKLWDIIFFDTECRPQHVRVMQYRETCYLFHMDGESGRLEINPDGRHDGLLDIDKTSPEEFAAWLDGSHPKRGAGGHPWEIKRGGNTTHIDLSVTRPPYRKEGFQVALRAPSLSRLAEALRMFLGIYREGLPISFDDADGVRKRLLGQDNIGIIPEYDTLHRANQLFEQSKDVYEVLHLSDLGRYKRRLIRFITWEPLPLLVPKGAE